VDVPREAWSQQGNLAIYWFEHGWIWMIPLQEGLTSVGAVCMPDYLKRRKGPLSDFFVETLRLCPTAWRVLSAASRATSVRAAGNYSYKADRAYGNGYLLLGDAYAFVDPVFSSGVYLAMSGAELAAAAIDECLDHPERAAVRFRQFQRQVDRGIKRFSWFIYRFNTPAMRGLFMRPRNILGVRKAVISLLAGDVYRGGGLTWRLAIFKLLYFASLFIHYRGSRRWENRRRRMRLISMPQDDIIEE
jgi:flavin-dependent dehydrogenase